MAEKISSGAEARVYRSGADAVKVRMKKEYRHPDIDKHIRKSRTKTEGSILSRAAPTGVTPKPRSLSCSIEQEFPGEFLLVMEWIDGESAYSALPKMSTGEVTECIKLIAQSVAKLHQIDIVHGDLVLNNILLVDAGSGVRIIDFGLGKISSKVEDRAVDIYLLEKNLKLCLLEVPDAGIEAIVEQGYRKGSSEKQAESVLQRLVEVRNRGRKRELNAVG